MTAELEQQIAELQGVHKGLTSRTELGGQVLLAGALPFEASAAGLETIADSFEIELAIPPDYPRALPVVRERAERIAPDYSHRYTNGALCLGVPVEERRLFLAQPTLLGFVNRLVVPYLYGYCFWRKHGRHPFDEAAHGEDGIVQHYLATLHLTSPTQAMAALGYLTEYGFRGHHSCPCGSKQRVRGCHGTELLGLQQAHTSESLSKDYATLAGFCFAKEKAGVLEIPLELQHQFVRIFPRIKHLIPA